MPAAATAVARPRPTPSFRTSDSDLTWVYWSDSGPRSGRRSRTFPQGGIAGAFRRLTRGVFGAHPLRDKGLRLGLCRHRKSNPGGLQGWGLRVFTWGPGFGSKPLSGSGSPATRSAFLFERDSRGLLFIKPPVWGTRGGACSASRASAMVHGRADQLPHSCRCGQG